jgi:hypothetical protein
LIGASDAGKPVQCSFQSFPLDHTVQSVAMSAGSAIYPTYATSAEMNWGVDMAGLWWMDGNKLAEEFVSWHGATSSNPEVFPMRMVAPTNLKGNWVWPSSIPGRFLMSYYAATEAPTVPQIATWHNASYAEIQPVADAIGSSGGAIKHFVLRKDFSDPSGDTWIRENTGGDKPPEYIYTLRRVMNGAGQPNAANWLKFGDYAGRLRLRTLMIWGNDDGCMRRCEILNFCWFCKLVCGRD